MPKLSVADAFLEENSYASAFLRKAFIRLKLDGMIWWYYFFLFFWPILQYPSVILAIIVIMLLLFVMLIIHHFLVVVSVWIYFLPFPYGSENRPTNLAHICWRMSSSKCPSIAVYVCPHSLTQHILSCGEYWYPTYMYIPEKISHQNAKRTETKQSKTESVPTHSMYLGFQQQKVWAWYKLLKVAEPM